MRKLSFFLILFAVLGFSVEFKLSLSYESFTLEATPASGISFVGPEIDIFTSSGKDVSMGLGLGLKHVLAPTDTSLSPYTIEIFSSAVYRGKITKSMWLEVHSKGGVSIPNLSFDRTGFFADVSVFFYMKFSGLDIGFGLGVRSYSFFDYGATYIPVRISIGKVF